MKTKKFISMILVTGMCLSLLAGCGKSSGGDEGSSDGKASSSSDKEITFWNPFVGTDGDNLKKLVDDYNNTNPEYKIKNLSLKEAGMYLCLYQQV